MQNTLKWMLDEMKSRKDFETKNAQNFMASRYCYRNLVGLAWEELTGAVVEVAVVVCRMST